MNTRTFLRKSFALQFAVGAVALVFSASHAEAQFTATTNSSNLGISVISRGSGGPVSFFDIFVDITPPGGLAGGQWFELPYYGSATPEFTLNYVGSGPITLSDAGYFISPTEIPLDNLNFGNDPPTGSLNSPYTPLPSFDSTYNPGQTASTPDSGSTLAFLGLAGGVLGAIRRRS